MEKERNELRDMFMEEIGEIVYKDTLENTIKTLATNDTLDFIEKLLIEREKKAREEGYREGLIENLDKRKSEGGLTILESIILNLTSTRKTKKETLVEGIERKYKVDLGVEKDTKLEELLKQKGLSSMSETLEDSIEENVKKIKKWNNTQKRYKDYITSEILNNGFERTYTKDATEEWEKDIKKVFDENTWFGINGIEDDGLDISQEDALDIYERIIEIVKQLLEEREEKARKEAYEKLNYYMKYINENE